MEKKQDEDKIVQNQKNTSESYQEELSPEELHARIEEDRKKLVRSAVLAFSAMVALIVLCIAWFVSNNKVSMTGGTISADVQAPFELASVGVRQNPETSRLDLNAGTQETETEYYDIDQKKVIATESVTYHVGTTKLAWYLNGQERISPGTSGQMDLYLIPQNSGLQSATIQLSLEARDESGQKIKNSVLQNLVNGHLLFFRKLDDNSGYQEWSGEDLTFTVTPEGGFQEEIPNKVTIYWVWPKYFRNYIYTSRSTQGDLFTSEKGSYSDMLAFVQKQTGKQSRLFYDQTQTEQNININGTINNKMNDEIFNACSDYYNQADEYIGDQATYVYISATVE